MNTKQTVLVMNPEQTGEGGSLSKWHVVLTLPNKESLAASHLLAEDIQAYFPRIAFKRPAHRAHSTIIENRVEALWPGYILAKFNYSIQHRLVKSRQGVADILRFADYVPDLADHFVDELIKHFGHSPKFVQFNPVPQSQIQIATGPFAGVHALVLESKGDRVRLLIDLLCRQTIIEMPVTSVAPETDPRSLLTAA